MSINPGALVASQLFLNELRYLHMGHVETQQQALSLGKSPSLVLPLVSLLSAATAVMVEFVKVEFGAVVVSEGRSSLECSVAGCLVVTTKAERFLRRVPLLVSTK